MVKLLIINSAEPHIREFVDPLVNIALKSGADPFIEEFSNLPEVNLESFDGLIISGSPCGDDIVEHHLPYFQWLKEYRKPLLGICAGHHITGVLFGSELYRSKEVEIGEILVEILKPYPLFRNMPEKFTARTMHHDSISLPLGFELIAFSSTCRNQVMKRTGHDFYTLQFHPELMNQQIIMNFVKIIKNRLEYD
ncbi:MAG: hypothetical protein JW798_00745 [Prolixibacteraceae bacterium]|nr:hypothetical protein [Prolixibacteraceae bacterium]